MADPTGISGIFLAKLVDLLIDETKTTKHCKSNCRALNKRLQQIKPLVYYRAEDLSTNGNGKVMAGNLRLLLTRDSMVGVLDMNIS